MKVLSSDERGMVLRAEIGQTGDWQAIRAELFEVFRLTKEAVAQGRSIVYVVRNDDLLGRDGVGPAIVATGLLSAARTAALEQKGAVINTLAIADDTAPGLIATWAQRLLSTDGPSGELVRLGGGHLGKALP